MYYYVLYAHRHTIIQTHTQSYTYRKIGRQKLFFTTLKSFSIANEALIDLVFWGQHEHIQGDALFVNKWHPGTPKPVV